MPGEVTSQPLSAMIVFLFTDLVDSTAWKKKLGDRPLEIFEVGVVGASPLVPPPDGEKVRRVTVDPEDDTGSWAPPPA